MGITYEFKLTIQDSPESTSFDLRWGKQKRLSGITFRSSNEQNPLETVLHSIVGQLQSVIRRGEPFQRADLSYYTIEFFYPDDQQIFQTGAYLTPDQKEELTNELDSFEKKGWIDEPSVYRPALILQDKGQAVAEILDALEAAGVDFAEPEDVTLDDALLLVSKKE